MPQRLERAQAQQLQLQGRRVHCVRPEELFPLGATLCLAIDGNPERIDVISGSVDDACIVEYSDATGLVGVVGVDRTAELAPYRKTLLARS